MGRRPQLSNSKKKQVKTLVEQASRALGNGRHNICEQLCAKIEALQPDNPHAANLRGIICSHSGQLDRAIALFEQAIENAPNTGEFHANLAKLYLDRERYEDAAQSYRQAVRCGIKTPPVFLNLSNALMSQGVNQEALTILKQAVARYPNDMDIRMALFQAHYNLELTAEAQACLQQILDREPDHADAHQQMGNLAMERGQFDIAEAEARTALETQPECVDAYVTLSTFKKYNAEDDADVVAMIALHEQSAPDSRDRMRLGFILAKVMDALQQYDRAFGYLHEANKIRRTDTEYDPDQERIHIQEVMAAYTPETLSHTSKLEDTTPIFVVGMPRCGSTLTEQILASHPDVASRGECDLFEGDVLFSMNRQDEPLTLERLTSFTSEQWQDVGMAYLERLRDNTPEALRITDKTLHNIRLIGAIHCALPKARIVHVRRNPLDTCLSIYKGNFRGAQFDYAYCLSELGHYYRIYLELMQHWRDILPAGVMYELDYENLVASQEEETRKLLDACGLDWNEQCLQFNQANNTVRTSSVAQVRRSMYKDSLAAWKRYEKHLEPLIRILGTEYGS